MDNWFVNKEEHKRETKNSIMGELSYLLGGNDKTANYWIDDTHNVFGFVNDNGDDDKWIEIHYELYDSNADIIGDLAVLSTDSISETELLNEIESVVNMYFNE